MQILPQPEFFAILHLLVHVNLTLHLLPSLHPTRLMISSVSSGFVPLRHTILFGMSSLAPFISLCLRLNWLELIWWSATLLLSWFIHSGQRWAKEEEEALQELEGLRYDAKGA